MDEQAAAKIERIAKSRGWTVEAILADPRSINLIESDGCEFLKLNRSRLEPGLLQRSRSAGAAERLRIGMVLLEMGAPSGSDLVLQALDSSDPAIVRGALLFLQTARWRQGEGLLIPLDQPSAAAALQPHLSSADPQARLAAVLALCRLTDAWSVERRVQLLTHRDARVSAEAAMSLATYHSDARAWPAIEAAYSFLPRDQRQRLATSLKGLARSGDGAVCERAANLARREIRTLYDHADVYAGNEAMNLLDALQALAPHRTTDILEELIDSKMATWMRTLAAGRLASGMDAPTMERRLLQWLDDPELASRALEIVVKLGDKANTPAIIARLRAELDGGVTDDRLQDLLSACIAIGAQDVVNPWPYADLVDGWRRFDFFLRSGRISAAALLEHLDRAELIPQASPDARAGFAARCGKDDAFHAMMDLLHEGGRVLFLNCEDACDPPDYLGLIGELAALSDGEVVIDDVAVKVQSPRLRIHLSANGLASLVDVHHQGEWIDINGLLLGLNEMLSEMESPRRFYRLGENDRYAFVVLARAGAMWFLASQVYFPVYDLAEVQWFGEA